MKRSIPPHIAWPAFVVAILFVGIGGAFSALFAAYSDGGVQIVEDYYEQAAAWDEIASQRAHSALLGWQTEVNMLEGASDTPLRTVEIVVRDAAGDAVSGLAGTVRAMRPHQSGVVAEVPLAPVADMPGHYRQQLPIGEAGLWDFEVTARKDTVRFQTSIRQEILL